jgi:hypothetical protein
MSFCSKYSKEEKRLISELNIAKSHYLSARMEETKDKWKERFETLIALVGPKFEGARELE